MSRLVIHPTAEAFARMSRQGTVVPVWAELLADRDTPVTAFQKLDDGRFSFLLESVEGKEKVARYSFLGSRPRLIFTSTGRHVEIADVRQPGRPRVRRFETRADPLEELKRLMAPYRPVPAPDLPRFCGGLVGYWAYDMVRFLERLPAHRVNDLRLPDIMLMLADSMVVFDHAQHRVLLVVNAFTRDGAPGQVYRGAVRRIEAMAGALRGPTPRARRAGGGAGGVRSNVSRAQFTRMVQRAKAYLRDGDIIQVVLSQRLERPLRAAPFDVYRALRALNPSPYMFFLRFGGVCLAGSSPEMLVRCEDGRLETRPIAGTRPRGRTPADDARLAEQMRRSIKERAEHLMLVDLGRNDLGRVARPGSVRTPEFMLVEQYSHVLHLVSSVVGALRPGRSAYDVLRATFPAGTVSGAPKVRAMEIIAELEPTARGPYAGAVGYLSFSGNLDTGITIRTVLMAGGRAYVQAGAGIVADSQPAREYQETLNKAKGMLKALEVAARGTLP
jgi:anthranilate synthase component 1